MCGWTIFILGILDVLIGALVQQPWVIPVVAVCWWIAQYRSAKRAKEQRIILKRFDELAADRTSL